MFHWKDYSLPTRVLALAIAIVLIGLALFISYRFIWGRVTMSATPSSAYVEHEGDEGSYPVPHTYRLKPGKRDFSVLAPGYLEQKVTVNVIAFLHRKQHVTLQRDASGETETFRIDYRYDKGAYLIVPKTPFTVFDPPQQQLASSWGDYEAYAKQALDFMRKKGVDPSTVTIEWWGQEWWPAGKSISVK